MVYKYVEIIRQARLNIKIYKNLLTEMSFNRIKKQNETTRVLYRYLPEKLMRLFFLKKLWATFIVDCDLS